MIPLNIFKYILAVIILCLIGIGAYIFIKSTLVKQIKFVIFWYLLILILNLLNVIGVIMFYENNKNRKGPNGFKGIVGPRGLKGESQLCQSCGLAGSGDNAVYADNLGIIDSKVTNIPTKCIFPFLANYQYQNDDTKTTVDLLENMEGFKEVFNKFISKDHDPKKYTWCATKVNQYYEPTEIGFTNNSDSIEKQLKSQKNLSQMKQLYQQKNTGIINIKIISENSLRAANRQLGVINSTEGANNPFKLIKPDLNQGTGGKFVYIAIQKGIAPRGITDIKITNTDSENDYTSFKIDLNENSKKNDGKDIGKELYLHYKKDVPGSGSDPKGFIQDIRILSNDDLTKGMGSGYVAVKDPDTPKSKLNLNDGGGEGTELYLYYKQSTDFKDIDTAFVYKDGSIYIFIGNKFYKISSRPDSTSTDINIKGTMKVIEGYPKNINQKWGKVPKSLTEAPDSITAEKCSLYNGDSDDKKEKCDNTSNCLFDPINKKCEPKQIYDAAFTDENGTTYFFKGALAYKYDDRPMKITAGYPKLISDEFKGIPSNIDAVFYSKKDKTTYFFKDKSYYKYDSSKRTVAKGYPKNTTEKWEGMPSVISAIFTVPFKIPDVGDSKDTGKNHTYIISQGNLHKINNSSNKVDTSTRSILDVFMGL